MIEKVEIKKKNLSDKKYYELTLLIRAEVSSEDIKDLLLSVKNILIDNSFKVEYAEYWGMRKLEYKISKYQNAHFYLLRFASDLATNNDILKKLDINDIVMRTLLLKYEDSDINIISSNVNEANNPDSAIVLDEKYKVILKSIV